MAEIAAIVGGIGAIVGGVVYLWKSGLWLFAKTPAQEDAAIDAQVAADQAKAEETGRPV